MTCVAFLMSLWPQSFNQRSCSDYYELLMQISSFIYIYIYIHIYIIYIYIYIYIYTVYRVNIAHIK